MFSFAMTACPMCGSSYYKSQIMGDKQSQSLSSELLNSGQVIASYIVRPASRVTAASLISLFTGIIILFVYDWQNIHYSLLY